MLRTIIFILVSFPLQAQLSKVCYDGNDNVVDENVSEYCVVGKRVIRIDKTATFRDSVVAFVDTVSAYYTATKKIKFVKIYSAQGLEHGNYVEYYANGKIKELGTAKNGFKNGFVNSFYPDGKAKSTLEYLSTANPQPSQTPDNYKIISYRDEQGASLIENGNGVCNCSFNSTAREVGKVVNGLKDSVWSEYHGDSLILIEYYRQGKFIEGMRYGQGQPFRYTKLKETAHYVDGNEAILPMIFTNWRNPAACYGLGEVEVLITINEKGSIDVVKIINGGKNARCNKEIINVVRLLKKWYPARARGKAIAEKYLIPINFKIF
jgi:TonB family protein